MAENLDPNAQWADVLDPQSLRFQSIPPFGSPPMADEQEGDPFEASPDQPLLIDVSSYQGVIDYANLARNA